MSSTDCIAPQIMGILNLTTDSFSDGGKWLNSNNALQHAMKMLEEGAQIIDIGAESTRPGSMPISAELEWSRIEPVLNSLSRQNIHCKISVDTQKSYVAERSIAAGATMINDISALEYDPEMLQVLKQHQDVELVVMHKQGNPETMQVNPQYDDVVTDVKDYLISRLEY
ncbi:MAG TPA: dihydropteroate synthase, partial [Candidatus Cloacimonadota bacterium]|nr:dihydropteroate synthase [Candidatus Cloacimonadota bacterium]